MEFRREKRERLPLLKRTTDKLGLVVKPVTPYLKTGRWVVRVVGSSHITPRPSGTRYLSWG